MVSKFTSQPKNKEVVNKINDVIDAIPTNLATVATSGSYNDLSNKPTIPTVNNATLTIQKNGTTVKTFTANASSNVTCNITVPTNTNELTNGAGFITSSSLPTKVSDLTDDTATYPIDKADTLTGLTASITELNYCDGVTSAIQTQLNGKQASITGGASTITSSDLTASKALVSNPSGKVAVSSVTSTELGYVSGVTSAIQTQLDGKLTTSDIVSSVSSSSTNSKAVGAKLFYDTVGDIETLLQGV